MVNVSMPHVDLDRRPNVGGPAAGVSRGKPTPHAGDSSSAFGSMVDSLSDDGEPASTECSDASTTPSKASVIADAAEPKSTPAKGAGARVLDLQRCVGALLGPDAVDEKSIEKHPATELSAATNGDDATDTAVVVAATLTAQLADLLQKIKDGRGDMVDTGRGQVSLTALNDAIAARMSGNTAENSVPAHDSLEEKIAAVADVFIKAVSRDVAAAFGDEANPDAVKEKVSAAVQNLIASRPSIDLGKIASTIDVSEAIKAVNVNVAELVKAITGGGAGSAESAPASTVPHAAALPSTSAFASAIAAAQGAGQPQAAELPDSTVLDLVRAIRMQATDGGGEARIQLRPEHFGEVTISIRVEEGQVLARVQAESAAVREWLQNNQGVLRHQLAEQRLTLDRLEVAEPSESREPGRQDPEQRPQQDQRRARRPRQDDEFQTFDVVA